MAPQQIPPQEADEPTKPKAVLFFDIDGCLYTTGRKVESLVWKLIDRYFENHLGLPAEEAAHLHRRYSRDYGRSIQGLVENHGVDPLEYNEQVDDALPMEDFLGPNPTLRGLLEDIDTSRVRLWLLTNAYVTHGKRVVRLLGVDDLFLGITYCDFSKLPLLFKPSREMFEKAMSDAGVERPEDCYFIDDSYENCAAAAKLGWSVVHFLEEGLPEPDKPAANYQIRNLHELRGVYPQFFKSCNREAAE
ncbi:pyrimidine 5'-nucleotidase [Xylariales sp. PMI_506]|nr:pyrimidine 5'-nucleotidase [Xylariales sp. PMI_506]